MSSDSSFLDRLNYWVKTSVGLKIFTIVFLVLILLIPIAMVEDLIRQREWKQSEATQEVSSTWGSSQTLTALVLTVPYITYHTVEGKDDEPDKEIETKRFAHFLPKELNISGEVLPEKRKRGIYEIILYKSELVVNGSFNRPNFSKLTIPEEDVLWNEAYVELGLSDLRSIQNNVSVNWGGEKVNFEPGVKNKDVISSGVSTAIPLNPDEKSTDFSFTLNFNGSNQIHFTPLGEVTKVHLSSDWKDPKFNGAFLPDQRDLTDGFTADWEVLHLNRNYPQSFTGSMQGTGQSSFGVELLVPVDHYQKSMRSVKYGVLFISLTFLVYFFTQIKNRLRIHFIQYLMVGLAICLFFTLLVALSEHIPFYLAYIIGSVGTIGMITAYSYFVFKDKILTSILAGILVILYGFIYIILQLQSYSLLIGSIGLFLILGAVMYMSRNIDWYNIGKEE